MTFLDHFSAACQRVICGDLSLLDFGNQAQESDPTWIWGLNFCIRKQTPAALDG